jgi:hypothetical protein
MGQRTTEELIASHAKLVKKSRAIHARAPVTTGSEGLAEFSAEWRKWERKNKFNNKQIFALVDEFLALTAKGKAAKAE